MSAIAQSFIQTLEDERLDPARTVLWCMRSKIACNLGMGSLVLKNLLNNLGQGLEQVELFGGDLAFTEFPVRTSFNTYFAFLFTGFLRRMAYRTRPYEKNRGETDAAISASIDLLEDTFEHDRDKQEALREVVSRFQRIPHSPEPRPKVLLFGDLYTRDNHIMNQDVVRMIEAHGAEVLPTPYTDYIKIVASSYLKKWFREGKYLAVMTQGSLLAALQVLERKFTRRFEESMGTKPAPRAPFDAEQVLRRFHLTDHHTGESVDNLLKVFYLLQEHSDLALFVQLNPSYCCPSLVTEAQARAIEADTGIPVVTLTYDGTPSPKNDVLIPYLRSLRSPAEARRLALRDASA